MNKLNYNDIWAGDFFSTEGKGILGWLNSKMTVTKYGNHTKEYHFGVIGDPIYYLDGSFEDFETRESIGKGPSTLRFFSQYRGKKVTLYRLKGITKEDGLRLVRSISLIGKYGYGYRDFFEAALDVFTNLIGLQFPPYRVDQFRSSMNKKYICTEVPAFGASQIKMSIEPKKCSDCWVIPVVYLEAIEDGKLEVYYEGNL